MSEYIIDTDGIRQLVYSTTTATLNAWLMRSEHEEFTFPMLPKIVRCRDCKYCMAYMAGTYCDYMAHAIEPDGFCAWAIKRNASKKHYDIQILDEYEIMCGGEGE